MVAWWRGSTARIEAVRIAADGAPGPVATLSEDGQSAYGPDLAIDGSDRAMVVWQRSDGSNTRIQSVRLDGSFTPGPLETLSGAGRDAANPRIAIDGSDRAWVVWQRSDGSNSRIQARRIAADGAPGPVETLSDPGRGAFDPQVAIDGSERATVVWKRYDGSNTRIQVVRLAADGTPGEVRTLSEAGGGAHAPQVAIDGSERATVTWQRSDGSNSRIQSVRLDPGGALGWVQTLSEPGDDARAPQVAVDASGRATVVWEREVLGDSRIRSARLDGGRLAGPVRTLSGNGEDPIARDPQVATDGSGRATVIWRRFICCGVDIVEARRLGEGSRAISVSSGAGFHANTPDPQLATDNSGRATIVWPQQDELTGVNHIESNRAEIAYPETTITAGPEGLIEGASPSFAFTDDVAGTGFECRLDSESFAACTSPHSYSGVPDGEHLFEVQAVDAEGDADPTPDRRSFAVDAITGLASARRKQRQRGKGVIVKAKLRAARERERLTARLGGEIRVGGRSHELRPETKTVRHGDPRAVKLRPKKGRSARRIARALGRGKQARARVTVRFSDGDGNRSSEKLAVKLTR